MLLWEHGIAYGLYERAILRASGRQGDPYWSPTAALDAVARAAAARKGLGPKGMTAAAVVYTLLWAPLAEELFYWGYLYGDLRAGLSAAGAGLVTSLFFGARHLCHFLYPAGPFPFAAAAALFVNTGVTAACNGLLYEKTRSLWPLIALHLASNLLSAFHARGGAADIATIRGSTAPSGRSPHG